jgi:hypothetical protein
MRETLKKGMGTKMIYNFSKDKSLGVTTVKSTNW